MSEPIRVEVDGAAATAQRLSHPALLNYGHFTALQVRSGRTRALDLHLRRLDAATRELFGVGLPPDRVREQVRHALAGLPDASVRVSVFQPGDDVSIMVSVRPPADPPAAPQRLRSVPYQRPFPHLKHTGTFAQIHHGVLAERDGYDDALLTGPDGAISETTISNVAFWDGTTLTWPDAPHLAGVTMLALRPQLAAAGLPARDAPVRLADLPSFTAALLTNSLGIATVAAIDRTTLAGDPDLLRAAVAAYESVPWDAI